MEEFSLATKIYAGAGAVSALRDFGAKRLLVVTDPFFMENGTAQRVARCAGAAETAYFDAVQRDATVALAAEGTAKLKRFRPDLLVALGGGSAMDCAKAMAYFARGTFPLVAIPTTSGSGSEVTDFAVLTYGRARHPLVDGRLRPDAAILDSDLLDTLPPERIADTGFDVLTHGLEAYAATNAGAFSDMYARESFRIAYALLPASYAGKKEARLRLHLASAMAGVAISQGGLGVCHAISHSLGGLFQVPHGRLNAALLPAVLSCNANAALHRYGELARFAGMAGSTDAVAVRNLKNGLLGLRRQLDLPESLSQAGIPPEKVRENLPRIVEAVLEDPCIATNPVPVEEGLIRRILEEAGAPAWRRH